MSSNKLKKTIKKLIGKNKFNRGKLTSNVSSTSYTDDSTFNESSNPKECLQQSSIEALPPASSNCSVSASFNEISIVKSSPPNKQSQSDVSIETVVNFKSLVSQFVAFLILPNVGVVIFDFACTTLSIVYMTVFVLAHREYVMYYAKHANVSVGRSQQKFKLKLFQLLMMVFILIFILFN